MSKSNYLQKNSFIDLNEPELIKLMQDVGGESFRINQINNWIYNNYVRSWDEMKNIPSSLISQLEKKIKLHSLDLIEITGVKNDPIRKFLFKTKKGNDGFLKSRWWGLRGMFIQNGITSHASNRLGILMGFQRNARWGMEFGYFHDPTSMPITELLNPKWDPTAEGVSPRFADKPMKDSATGFPSEYSRFTGLSISIFFDLDAPKKKK